jgi:hypothetical protein
VKKNLFVINLIWKRSTTYCQPSESFWKLWRSIINVYQTTIPNIIFASQGLRFGSPVSPPLADLEYILRIHALIFHWLRLPVHVSNQKTLYTEHMLSTKSLASEDADTDDKCNFHNPSLSDRIFCNTISMALRNISQNLNVGDSLQHML